MSDQKNIDNQSQNQTQQSIKLDYTITSPQERVQLVEKIIAATPAEQLSPQYLEILSNYIIFAMTKEEKKEKKINTVNRMVTIRKRETSYEGLVCKFENGEDGIYNVMIQNDKNIILTPKIQITEEDLAAIPDLQELRENINLIEKAADAARGKKRFLLKKQLIEMRQDQYVIKNAFKKPIICTNVTKGFHSIDFNEDITVNKNGTITDNSLISLLNFKHISALLCNYSKLKEDCYGKFYSDGYFLMEVLDELIEKSLKDKYPFYYDLMILKIDGATNLEIQNTLNEKYNVKHSIEYISSLWRNKIPKLIAEQAKKDYLEWYFTIEKKGKWKKCSRCGQIKLANNEFFSKNTSSKDGFYSICKECRNAKKEKPVSTKKIIKKITYAEFLRLKEVK